MLDYAVAVFGSFHDLRGFDNASYTDETVPYSHTEGQQTPILTDAKVAG